MTAREWWADGERTLGTALGRLVPHEYAEPSLLPGWTRAHVLAHVAGNADAVTNLLHWARTGVETPMYPSAEARDAEIERRAALAPPELEAEVLAATRELAEAVASLPEEAWTAEVRTFQGRTVPATEVFWIRAREVWVHAVDLDAGVGFADAPEELLAAVVDEVFGAWSRRGAVPAVTVFAGDREWGSGGVAVAGSLADVAGWVTGRTAGEGLRCDGPLPALPRWI
ncbi:maleylpyruvate isomerase family mycothiol-dependent enzyme [Blastococcus sp. TF02A-26]|uniref:maleylpyruvate isomerase family mycothiol-dependent enzyme n=1 Tax=Blastococcus sp. TF02A-26 TaxID=2250577 RepID=UPI0013144588|nr:maleylpyruvate isomerase family mycothiol-dependent enzyme [Blastococcus sp. TF02A-26]